jgi:hypothetical protein
MHGVGGSDRGLKRVFVPVLIHKRQVGVTGQRNNEAVARGRGGVDGDFHQPLKDMTMSTIGGVSGANSAWTMQRSQHQAKMFNKVDTDTSGGVDATELTAFLKEAGDKKAGWR